MISADALPGLIVAIMGLVFLIAMLVGECTGNGF